MADTNNVTAAEVAAELAMSPQTLRAWCADYAPFLSPPGVYADGARRFTGGDVTVLKRIKDHLAAGLTKEEMTEELRNAGYADGANGNASGGSMVVNSAQQGFGVLTDTLRVMIENQQTIQNSLQVNRNLLGVIIQDNFNLKEENSKLRDRMLRLEQELAEVKRRDSDYRLYLEQKLNRMDNALRAETGKTIWQKLFGGQ